MYRALPLLFLTACAPGYASLEGGPVFSRSISNNHEIETGTEPNLKVNGSLGMTLVQNGASLSAELVGGYEGISLHGVGARELNRSADGQTMHIGSVGVRLKPTLNLTKRLNVFLGLGAGGAHISGLNDTDIAGYYEAQIGLEYSLTESLSGTLGYGYRGYRVNLDGLNGPLDLDGPFVGLKVKF